MKLFDTRLNAIRTFGLHIKHLFNGFNIDFTNILETPSCFVSPPWCIKPPKIVLDLMHLKKDVSGYKQLFIKYETGIVISIVFIQTDQGMMGIMWHVLRSIYQTPSFSFDCLIKLPFLLQNSGQS